jgi:hypothetical protein
MRKKEYPDMSFDFDISTLPPEARRAGGEAQENSSAICAHHRPLVAAAAITNAVHYWSYSELSTRSGSWLST